MSQNFGEKDDVPPSWWVLSFIPDPEYVDQITRLLFAAGCSGVWEREKNDGQLETVAYFPFDRQEELTALCRRLIPFLLDHGAVEVEKIDQQNWMEGWKEHFRPVKLTPSWWCCRLGGRWRGSRRSGSSFIRGWPSEPAPMKPPGWRQACWRNV